MFKRTRLTPSTRRGRALTDRFSSGPFVVPCMKEHTAFRNRLFNRSHDEMATHVFSGVLLRCSFLESVAALPGKHAAYLQDELARQPFSKARRGDSAPSFLRAGEGFSSTRPKETHDKKRLSRNHLQKSLCFRNVSVVLSPM